jgi:hypothetical protein
LPGREVRRASRTSFARIGDLIELDPGKSAILWLVKLKKVLKRALRVRDRRDDAQIGPHGLMVAIGQIESEFDRLLHQCPRHRRVAV